MSAVRYALIGARQRRRAANEVVCADGSIATDGSSGTARTPRRMSAAVERAPCCTAARKATTGRTAVGTALSCVAEASTGATVRHAGIVFTAASASVAPAAAAAMVGASMPGESLLTGARMRLDVTTPAALAVVPSPSICRAVGRLARVSPADRVRCIAPGPFLMSTMSTMVRLVGVIDVGVGRITACRQQKQRAEVLVGADCHLRSSACPTTLFSLRVPSPRNRSPSGDSARRRASAGPGRAAPRLRAGPRRCDRRSGCAARPALPASDGRAC